MLRLLFVLFFFGSINCFAQTTAKLHVVTHNRATVVCNPATGTKSFVNWGVFPSEKFPIRKIKMHVTLGSPDSLITAHW